MNTTALNKSTHFQYLDTYLMIGIYLSSILISFLNLPQLITGSIINFLIIFSTLKYGFKKSIPVLIFPSIMAYFNGMLFGSANIFLAYFVPFIILSNVIYSFVLHKTEKKTLGYILGSVLKASVLFLTAYLFVMVLDVPSLFLKIMGVYQLITALVGGGLAIFVKKQLTSNS